MASRTTRGGSLSMLGVGLATLTGGAGGAGGEATSGTGSGPGQGGHGLILALEETLTGYRGEVTLGVSRSAIGM